MDSTNPPPQSANWKKILQFEWPPAAAAKPMGIAAGARDSRNRRKSFPDSGIGDPSLLGVYKAAARPVTIAGLQEHGLATTGTLVAAENPATLMYGGLPRPSGWRTGGATEAIGPRLREARRYAGPIRLSTARGSDTRSALAIAPRERPWRAARARAFERIGGHGRSVVRKKMADSFDVVACATLK